METFIILTNVWFRKLFYFYRLRVVLTKLRINGHGLAIERGKYDGIDKNCSFIPVAA